MASCPLDVPYLLPPPFRNGDWREQRIVASSWQKHMAIREVLTLHDLLIRATATLLDLFA